MKRRVTYAGRTYEIDPDWRVYRIVQRGRGHQRVREENPHILREVTRAFLQQREARNRRRAEALRARHREKPAPEEPEPRPSPVRRALGYPLRWLRAWLRAREIEPEAGIWTWTRKATTWARTD